MRCLGFAFVIIVFCTSLFAFSANYSFVKPEQVGLSSNRLERLDQLVENHLEQKKIADAVLLVIEK